MWLRLERKISFLCLFVYLFIFFAIRISRFFLFTFFVMRIFPSAFSHPHPPSAGIRSTFYRHPHVIAFLAFRRQYSQALLKPPVFKRLRFTNTQNMNVIHYTGFRTNWRKFAIKLRSFSATRNACTRGMFCDWPVWIFSPRKIWFHKPSEKSVDILSVKWEKSHVPLNVLLWLASQFCEAGMAFKIPQLLKLFNLNRTLQMYSELLVGRIGE